MSTDTTITAGASTGVLTVKATRVASGEGEWLWRFEARPKPKEPGHWPS